MKLSTNLNEMRAQLSRRNALWNVGPTFVADGQATESMQPRQRPLHHPAVATESLLRRGLAPRDPRSDAPVPTGAPATREVVGHQREACSGASGEDRSDPNGPNAVEQALDA